MGCCGSRGENAIVNGPAFPPLQVPVVEPVKIAEETKVDSPLSVVATDEVPVVSLIDTKDVKDEKQAEQKSAKETAPHKAPLAKKASTSKFRRPADVLLERREKAKEAKNIAESKNNNNNEEDDGMDEVDEALDAITRLEKMITVVSPRAKSLNEPIRVPSPQLSEEQLRATLDRRMVTFAEDFVDSGYEAMAEPLDSTPFEYYEDGTIILGSKSSLNLAANKKNKASVKQRIRSIEERERSHRGDLPIPKITVMIKDESYKAERLAPAIGYHYLHLDHLYNDGAQSEDDDDDSDEDSEDNDNQMSENKTKEAEDGTGEVNGVNKAGVKTIITNTNKSTTADKEAEQQQFEHLSSLVVSKTRDTTELLGTGRFSVYGVLPEAMKITINATRFVAKPEQTRIPLHSSQQPAKPKTSLKASAKAKMSGGKKKSGMRFDFITNNQNKQQMMKPIDIGGYGMSGTDGGGGGMMGRLGGTSSSGGDNSHFPFVGTGVGMGGGGRPPTLAPIEEEEEENKKTLVRLKSLRTSSDRSELVRLQSWDGDDQNMLQLCHVCLKLRDKGIYCDQEEHFTCRQCFANHVETLCRDPASFKASKSAVYCPCPGCGSIPWNSYHMRKILANGYDNILELYVSTMMIMMQDLTAAKQATPMIFANGEIATADQEEIIRLRETIKILKKQLQDNNIMAVEYIPLNELQAELNLLIQYANEGLKHDEIRLDYLVECMKINPDFIAQQEEIQRRWKEDNMPYIKQCLDEMRGYIPCDIFTAGMDRLLNEYKLPMDLAKRYMNKKCLWLVRLDPAQIEKMHEADLTHRYNPISQNLDIVELSAIYAALPETFQFDGMGKKRMWRQQIEEFLQKAFNDLKKGSLKGNQIRFMGYKKEAPKFQDDPRLYQMNSDNDYVSPYVFADYGDDF